MNRMKHLLCVLLVAALGSFTFKANATANGGKVEGTATATTVELVQCVNR